MKWTNHFNIDQAIADAVMNDPYTKGSSDISVTTLIAPPRIRVLRKKYEDKRTEDVSDRIDVLFGQAIHTILDRANKTALGEERFYLNIDGVVLSGQADLIYENEGVLKDYKTCSYHEVSRGVKPDYEAQLNVLSYLARYGSVVDKTSGEFLPSPLSNKSIGKLADVYLFKDWSKGKARRDRDIPQKQIYEMTVPVWSDEKTLEFIKSRIDLHKKANKRLPLCTNEERWAVPDKWAVMPSKGAAKSVRNYEDKKEAEEHSARLAGSFLEIRPGSQNRCEGHCNVASFCSQYQKIKKGSDK